MTKEDFIQRANEKHNFKYDYSLVPDTMTTDTKIKIICNEKHPWGEPHGCFEISVNKHLYRGDGCTKCSGKYKRTKEDFVKEATYIHNGLYTYDNFVWGGVKSKGVIHCTKHNIDFEMTPCHHLAGQGCNKCRYEKASASKTKPFEKFVEKANEIHNGKYLYDKSTYIKGDVSMKMICPIHGEFWQTPNNHTNVYHSEGCPKCGREDGSKARTMSFSEFVTRANVIHNNSYDYIEKTYTKASETLDICCKKHGVFSQVGLNHLSGQGCPKCSNQMSKAEDEICDFIQNELHIKDIIRRDRVTINPYELDIFIPSEKIAFEFNGLIWHSNKFNDNPRHLLDKKEMCYKNGIHLIHIFEDEWVYNKDVIKYRISAILNKFKRKLYARKCTIKEVNSIISNKFLNENHIQGGTQAKYRYGLFYKDELVSLMTFSNLRVNLGKKASDKEFELIRFCNKANMTVVGGASKLLKHFINDVKPKVIISYADKRWSDGYLYDTLGFEHTHDSKPNYFYVIGKHRENRFKYRKSELVKQGFDATKSEKEIMEERGIPRIYDCGCLCYRMEIK